MNVSHPCVVVVLQGGERSRSTSVVSLTVETALGSFDFLNASDWDEEEEGGHHANRPVLTDTTLTLSHGTPLQ